MNPDGETAAPAEDTLAALAADAVDEGLLEATAAEIEELLGQRLAQDILAQSSRGLAPPPWAAGDYGPASLARRFLKFQSEAIKRQVCKADGAGLKDSYARLLKADSSKAGALTGAAGTIMATLDTGPGTTLGPAAALYVALWLGHANLETWCINGGPLVD